MDCFANEGNHVYFAQTADATKPAASGAAASGFDGTLQFQLQRYEVYTLGVSKLSVECGSNLNLAGAWHASREAQTPPERRRRRRRGRKGLARGDGNPLAEMGGRAQRARGRHTRRGRSFR